MLETTNPSTMPQLIVIKIVRIEADISSRNGRRCG
jgi:hypothetical protein